jgi:hypothetical protein
LALFFVILFNLALVGLLAEMPGFKGAFVAFEMLIDLFSDVSFPDVLGAIVLLFFGAMIVSGPFKSVYGRELLFWANLVHITADSVPDSRGGVDVVTLPPLDGDDPVVAKRGIRHSIHQNPACGDAVGAWISARMQAGRPA